VGARDRPAVVRHQVEPPQLTVGDGPCILVSPVIGAVNEHQDLPAIAELVGAAVEVLVEEESQVLRVRVVTVDRALVAVVGSCTEQQHALPSVSSERLESLDVPVGDVVLPRAGRHHGDAALRDRSEVILEHDAFTPPGVEVAVLDRIRVLGTVLFARLPPRSRECPPHVPQVVVTVGAGHIGRDGLQTRWQFARRQPLADAHQRGAVHADVAAAPRLISGPFHEVVAILGVVVVQRALALGGAAPPHRSVDDGEAAGRQAVEVRAAAVAIGDDEAPPGWGAVQLRQPQVGIEQHAVAHGNLHPRHRVDGVPHR